MRIKMTTKLKIGIIGGGFVGGATALLSSETVETIIYDLDPKRCKPEGTTFEDILQTEGVFIAVPTPITITDTNYGKCNTKIVDSVIKQLIESNYKGYIIVRSTVPVGYCDSHQSKNIHFMPEFLTEKNWAEDFINCKLWVFGVSPFCSSDDANVTQKWFQNVLNESSVKHKECKFMSTKEGEMIKYFRNCFLAVKVSFCNEMYRFAEAHGIQYETIRSIACTDDRIGHSHSFVPGHDGHYGFGLSCLSKDPASVEYQMNQLGLRCEIISSALRRNNEVDRPEKDWLKYA